MTAVEAGLQVLGFASSGLPGPKGNRETFIWCGAEGHGVEDVEAAVARGGAMSSEVTAPTAVRKASSSPIRSPTRRAAALRAAAAAAQRLSCTLLADPAELAKHGEAVSGIEGYEAPREEVDLCLVLGGDGTILQALRTFAGTGVPIFGINFGTVGFLAAAERDEFESGLERAFSGDFEVMTLPGLRARIDTPMPVALERRLVHAQAPGPRGRALVPAGRAGGRPRALRRAGRSHPRRLDRLQPRQSGPDPRLGGEGLRGQLRRAAHAHGQGAGGRSGRRAPRSQPGGSRPRRRGPGRRPGRRAGERRGARGSLPRRASAGWRSCRDRTSTAESGRSSATWLTDGAQVVDIGRRLRGDVHVAARHHDRQRRAPVDPARPRRQPLEPPVGGRRLRADARLLPARLRIARRPARAPADLLRRLRRLHGRVVALRPVERPHRPQLLPRPPGRGRRGDVRDLPGPDRAGVRGKSTCQRDRHLGRDRRRGGGHRPARRRSDHGRVRMGMDLLRQRPDRDRGDRPDRDEAGERGGLRSRSPSTGPAWPRSRWRSSASSSGSSAATRRGGRAPRSWSR